MNKQLPCHHSTYFKPFVIIFFSLPPARVTRLRFLKIFERSTFALNFRANRRMQTPRGVKKVRFRCSKSVYTT